MIDFVLSWQGSCFDVEIIDSSLPPSFRLIVIVSNLLRMDECLCLGFKFVFFLTCFLFNRTSFSETGEFVAEE